MAYPQVEDLVNMSLNQIGYTRPIQDIYEGSAAARVALTYYSQTRRETLQMADWPFAFREVALAAAAGTTPPSPWTYEYAFPTDCMRMRYVRPGPLTGGTRNNNPTPLLFKEYNDQTQSPPIRAILSDQNPAVLVYNGDITDPTTWPPEFIKTFVAALAEKLSFGLFKSAEIIKGRVELAAAATAEGTSVDSGAAPMDVPVNGPQR